MTGGTGVLEIVALFAFGLIFCLSALRRHLPHLPIGRSRAHRRSIDRPVRFEPFGASSDTVSPVSAAPEHSELTRGASADALTCSGPADTHRLDRRFHSDPDGVIPLAQALRENAPIASCQDPPTALAVERRGAFPAEVDVAGKILLVDSRDGFRTSMLLRLARAGYRVFPVARSRDAIDAFARETADLVLIHRDALIELGGDFVRRLRALSQYVPILVHGGHPGSGDVGRLRHGADITVVASAGDDTDVLTTLVDCAIGSAHSARRAGEAIESGSRILSDLCYHFRSALEVISGYVEILGDTPDLERHRDTLDRVRASASSVTGQLRGCAAIAPASAEPARIERVDLAALSAQIHRLVSRAIGDRPLNLTTTGPVHGSALFTDGEKLLGILSTVVTEIVRFDRSADINIAVRSHPDRTDFVVSEVEPSISSTAATSLGGEEAPEGASASGLGVGAAVAERWSRSIGATISVAAGRRGVGVRTVSVPARLMTVGRGAGAQTVH